MNVLGGLTNAQQAVAQLACIQHYMEYEGTWIDDIAIGQQPVAQKVWS